MACGAGVPGGLRLPVASERPSRDVAFTDRRGESSPGMHKGMLAPALANLAASAGPPRVWAVLFPAWTRVLPQAVLRQSLGGQAA